MKNYYKGLIWILFWVAACKEQVPFPQVNEGLLSLSPSGDTVNIGKLTLLVPAGAVSQHIPITVNEESNCFYTYPSDEIYFFKCMTGFGPENTDFNFPVILTITEDKYWLRPVNQLGLAQDYLVNKLRLYEINTSVNTITEIPDAKVQVKGNKISVSGAIIHTGNYQIGIPKKEILFAGGKMEARLTGALTKSVIIENSSLGGGGASRQTEYLSNKTTTAIGLYADPSRALESDAIQVFTTATDIGNLYENNKSGENTAVVIYFEDNKKYTVRAIAGQPATINITRYDPIGGLVEGTYQTEGQVTPGEFIVDMAITFSVRRIL